MSCSGHPGNRVMLAIMRHSYDLDHSQSESVFHSSLRRSRVRRDAPPPTEAKWRAFLTEQQEKLAFDDSVSTKDFNRWYRRLEMLKTEQPPDGRVFSALKDLPVRSERAAAAIRRQIGAAAAMRGVGDADVAERFHAYRRQYIETYRHLPAGERPDPPPHWVTGFTRRDMMAVSAPRDRATLYAMYRCQADPDAFGPNTATYASVDLETAGPEGRDGFEPENGSIIEVGIVEYDAAGRELSRYSQLVHPDPDGSAQYGTGAVHVHHITLDDVRDAPSWEDVAPAVAERLNGRVMLAQNSPFERDWLHHHVNAAGVKFDKNRPTVDTLHIARQHLDSDVANHRLETICAAVGVDYTDGHRATHDAEAAGRAYFAMRTRMERTWAESPVRASAPQPTPGYGHRVRRNAPVVFRQRGGEFDPRTVVDPWTTPPLSA